MYELKYKDKSVLEEYDLSSEIFDEFDLDIEDIYPVRNVFYIKTQFGDKILKKIDYSLDELRFIYDSVKYINLNFTRIFKFYETKSKDIYIKYENQVYCILDLIEGRECEISNPFDLVTASKALAEFHRASEGIKCNIKNRNNCGKIIDTFNRKLEEVNFFKSIVSKFEHKNEFDEIFLQNVDYYLEEIKKSINLLEKSQYYKLCSEEDKIVLCHHDLAHHNILINNGEAYFVDFDYAIVDLKVHDLCNFINKSIKNFAYDFEKAKIILKEYCNNNNLEYREIEVLYGMLSFPQDFMIYLEIIILEEKSGKNRFLLIN